MVPKQKCRQRGEQGPVDLGTEPTGAERRPVPVVTICNFKLLRNLKNCGYTIIVMKAIKFSKIKKEIKRV